tara:strand:+ start:2320 stop:2526 length:207 start_codon:yes stop_codon:yes gene_type:complete
MKVGDYVAKIQNEWQKKNHWMKFPGEESIPLGVIVKLSLYKKHAIVLVADGNLEHYLLSDLEVISDNN